jgi:hypothetical protein
MAANINLLSRNPKLKRFRITSSKTLFKVSFQLFFLVSIVLITLTFYTPWILHRTYNPQNEALEKSWTINPWPIVKSLFPNIFFENYAAINNVLFATEAEKKSEIPKIKIFVKNNGLEELDLKNLQYQLGGFDKKQRINGFLQNGTDQLIPIKLNMRGTMYDHHQAWKPSIRLRLGKNKLINGFRNHTLIAPSDGIGFSNWLSNELSSYWNMLGVKEHFVSLYINDKYFGVYNRIWRLDESLLINSNRLPGPFFRLEPLDKRLSFIGNFLTWDDPQGWQPKGVTSLESQKILSPPINIAKEIINWNISKGKKELIAKITTLNEWMDNDTFAKYQAILTHSGENHIDAQHNNAYWLDQSSGKLAPILMDVQGYSQGIGDWSNLNRSIIKSGSAFVDAWLKHPSNYSNYIDRLWETLTTFGSSTSVEKIIRDKYKIIKQGLISDVNFSLAGSPRTFYPVTQTDNLVEHFIEFVKTRNEWLVNKLTSDEISIIEEQNNRFTLFVKGYSGVNGKRSDGESFYIKGSKKTVAEFAFKPHVNLLVNQIEDFPTTYGFYEISGRPSDYIFSHRLNNKIIKLKPFKNQNHLKILKLVEGFNILSISKPDTTPIELGPGEIVFNQSKEFNEKQPVKIVSGTTLKLGSKVSLIFKGPLIIEGNKHNPVKIKPLVSDEPFGSVAIIGKETVGSSIKYLEMEGGSIASRFNLKFTGMLSVHDCPKIKISKSTFGKNFIGDDTVHIVRSKATIQENVFKNSHSDALDWDKVDGIIKNNHFLNSGNDGIDLSMGKVKIIGNHFQKCSDKCISAGEGTKVEVRDTKIRQCNIGISIKDRSTLKISDSVIDGCNIALNPFKKKWRWEKGGVVEIQNTQLTNSIKADILGDKLSKINFLGPIPKNLNIKGKVKVASISN